jgi:PilZ domain
MSVGTNKSRKDMRAVVSLVARYRSPTTFEYANESCSDVSVGGMFIKSAAPAPAGTLLKLECDTDSGNSEAKIRGVARVVWLRREANEHGPSGMGVKFVKLEPGSRELIEEIVARLAEAGVQARSVSAAPEQRLAAAGGAAATFAEPAPAASPVKLVPSTPPEAADSGARAEADRAPAAAAAATGTAAAIADKAAEAERAAKPAVVNQAPRTATVAEVVEPSDESRASLGATGSSRPPKPQPSRFGWKVWVGLILVILIAIAIADRRGFGPEKTEVAPETPSAQPEPAPAPTPAAAAPTPSPQPSEPAQEPSQPTAAEPAAAEKPAATAEPAAAPAGDEKPAAAVAAPTAAAASGEAPSEPLFPSEPGKPDYVVDFVSTPNGSTVTIDEKVTIVTPATVNLGAMPERIKVTAKKAGFKTSSIWMKRDNFELKGGVLKRRAMITLSADRSAAQ